MKSVQLKDGTTLKIREARGDDAEKIIEYMNAVGGESNFLTFGKKECRLSAEEERDALQNLLCRPPNLFLVGFAGDGLACCANFVAPRNARVAHNCEMSVTVRKKYWHLGAATALLEELIAHAKANPSLEAVHLGVYENNGRAIHLYRKFGFEYGGCLRRYFRVGDRYYDEILMDLSLRR